MEYIVTEYVLSFLDTVINFFFLEKMFCYKESKRCYRYIFMFLYFMVAQYMMAYLVPQMIGVILVEILYCVVLMKGGWYERIIWPIILNIIYCAISSVMLPLLSIMTGKAAVELASAGSLTRIWMVLIQKLLICTVLWGILLFKDKWLNLTKTEKITVAILLVANLFIVSEFYVISVKSPMTDKMQGELFGITLLIVVVLIICAVLIVKISTKNRQVLENNMLRYQLENQNEMIDNMKRNAEEVKILRHDSRHYAVIIGDLIKRNKNDKAMSVIQRYIDKTVEAEQGMDYIKDNSSINAVIHNCVCECNKKDIACDISITASYPDEIEQDIAVVFANLLDNAIRAEESEEKRKRNIKITIYKKDKVVIATIKNYINKSVLDVNPSLKTSKQDEYIHGLGLKSVKNIVNQLGGAINFFEDNNSFNVVIKILFEYKAAVRE